MSHAICITEKMNGTYNAVDLVNAIYAPSATATAIDNGNVILDVHGMEILDPIAMENAINAIPGVVTVGLFANRGADVALIGTADGVKTIVK